ncbi:MAG: energy-coupling factor transporter transmembrane component T [Bacillota bacterium]|nr:energy-coupling factor transporter transmembrane component T [Bacillota bacterium]
MQTPFAYFDSPSFVHRLHPVVKLGFVLATLVVILLPYFPTGRDYGTLLLWLGLAGLFWVLAGIHPRRFYVLLKILLATFAFLVLVQGFMYRGGRPLLVLGHLPIPGGADLGVLTDAGLLFGILLCIRVLVAVASVPVFVSTTSPGKVMAMFRRLGIPNRFAFMFVSALTFTDLIFEMWNSILDAQKLRGFDLSSMGTIDKLRRGFIPVVVPLILLLFRRGDELEIAMGGKGFGAPGRPTELEPLRFGWRDLVAASLIAGAVVGVYVVKFL